MPVIAELLAAATERLAAVSETPRLDAEVLLGQVLDRSRTWLFTWPDRVGEPAAVAAFTARVARRAAGEPVAYITGVREFWSLPLAVAPATLIPRPDTETLVVELLDLARELPAAASILEIGTGSGCIAISIASGLSSAQLTATDISPAALAVASTNATTHEVADRIVFLEGDLFEPLDSQARFDFIASNPPYVTTAQLDQLAPDIRDHEPHTALDGGLDGLDLIRRLITSAPGHLAPAGTLLCEISPEQSDAVGALLAEQPAFGTPRFVDDLAGKPRVVVVSLQPVL